MWWIPLATWLCCCFWWLWMYKGHRMCHGLQFKHIVVTYASIVFALCYATLLWGCGIVCSGLLYALVKELKGREGRTLSSNQINRYQFNWVRVIHKFAAVMGHPINGTIIRASPYKDTRCVSQAWSTLAFNMTVRMGCRTWEFANRVRPMSTLSAHVGAGDRGITLVMVLSVALV